MSLVGTRVLALAVLFFVHEVALSAEEIALNSRMGDWVVHGDNTYRSAFTEAETTFFEKSFLTYQCMRNERGCFFRLGIVEQCTEGEIIPIKISTDIHERLTQSTCTYNFSRSRDSASLIFKDIDPTSDSLGSSSKIKIKRLDGSVTREYKASLVGASQSILYVNEIYVE